MQSIFARLTVQWERARWLRCAHTLTVAVHQAVGIAEAESAQVAVAAAAAAAELVVATEAAVETVVAAAKARRIKAIAHWIGCPWTNEFITFQISANAEVIHPINYHTSNVPVTAARRVGQKLPHAAAAAAVAAVSAAAAAASIAIVAAIAESAVVVVATFEAAAIVAAIVVAPAGAARTCMGRLICSA